MHIHKNDTASLKSPAPHCVFAQQKQPIGNMQPETRSLPQRASHRPQSRDTPHVLLILAACYPTIQCKHAQNDRKPQTQTFWPVYMQGTSEN